MRCSDQYEEWLFGAEVCPQKYKMMTLMWLYETLQCEFSYDEDEAHESKVHKCSPARFAATRVSRACSSPWVACSGDLLLVVFDKVLRFLLAHHFNVTHPISKLDTVKLVGILQKLWTESGSNELCVLS